MPSNRLGKVLVTVKLGKVSELICVIILKIKLQFFLLSVNIFILSVTISLEKVICWPLNRGKKPINTKLVTAKRWPLNRGIEYTILLTNNSGLWLSFIASVHSIGFRSLAVGN